MTDLLKILKAGDKVFSMIHGKVMKIKAIDPTNEMAIDLGPFKFNKNGSIIPGGSDCLIFPSEHEKTWDNFSPFKIGEIVLVSNDEECRFVGVYSHYKEGKHCIFDSFQIDKFEYREFENCEYITVVANSLIEKGK